MSIRDELADILEALDGSDYMDVADTILARFAVVELPERAKNAPNCPTWEVHNSWDRVHSLGGEIHMTGHRKMTTAGARQLATALLAAAQHAEVES